MGSRFYAGLRGARALSSARMSRNQKQVTALICKAMRSKTIASLISYVNLMDPNLWAPEKEKHFVKKCTLAALYKYIKGVDYSMLDQPR